MATSRSSSRATSRRDAPADGRSARRGVRPHPRDPAARRAQRGSDRRRPRWPMIVLRSPKGWTGPKEVDGKKVEGFWRAHQVPIADAREQSRASRSCSKTGCAATSRKTLFDEDGALRRRTAGARARRATGAWAPTRTPMAAAEARARTAGFPRLRRRRPAARRRRRRSDARHGRLPARRHRS